VAEQLAQGNASTALTFNMHCLTMLMMGPIADNMAMPPAVRERHEKLRAAKFREVVEDGAFYGQPHSEPVEQGETDTTLRCGRPALRHPRGPTAPPRARRCVAREGTTRRARVPSVDSGDDRFLNRRCGSQLGADPGSRFRAD
jgi:hypothetical protein